MVSTYYIQQLYVSKHAKHEVLSCYITADLESIAKNMFMEEFGIDATDFNKDFCIIEMFISRILAVSYIDRIE